jgi:ADP-ribosylglycohydrolase
VFVHNTLAGYVRHRRHRNVRGTYADDTQMSLAVAEVMVEGRPWTANTLAERPCRPACWTPTRGTHTVGKSGSAAIFEGTD